MFTKLVTFIALILAPFAFLYLLSMIINVFDLVEARKDFKGILNESNTWVIYTLWFIGSTIYSVQLKTK